MTPQDARTLLTDAMGYWKQANTRMIGASIDGRHAVIRDAENNLKAAADQVDFAIDQLLHLATLPSPPGTEAR